jgi:hypothetical protein
MYGKTLKLIDDLENPAANLLGGARQTLAIAPARVAIEDLASITIGGVSLNQFTGHQTHVAHLGPGSAAATRWLVTAIPATERDWSGLDTLIVSLGGWFDPTSDATIAGAPLPRMKVTLIDGTGRSATVDFNTYGANLPSRPIRVTVRGASFALMRLETVPIALSAFVGIDTTKVASVAFDVNAAIGNTHVFIDNVHVVKR